MKTKAFIDKPINDIMKCVAYIVFGIHMKRVAMSARKY